MPPLLLNIAQCLAVTRAERDRAMLDHPIGPPERSQMDGRLDGDVLAAIRRIAILLLSCFAVALFVLFR